MSKFGFTISKDQQIDYDHLSRELARYIQKAEPTVYRCMSCGSCAGSCSAAKFTQFSFRKLVTGVLRGDDRHIIGEIQKCMLCGKCMLVCPRGVNTRNVIHQLRKALNERNRHEV
ncbi:MAG: 4Fe-4S dicluster domain-containing protein [Bacteroidota bacterium]|nr:4Fe-4S dicluster domain-containing protein [Bacteroidota bacterium]